MTEREALARLRDALALHLDALADALESGAELVEDRGQHEHARDVLRRYRATAPRPPSAN